MPKVSVVIPCYNLGRYLDEAVDSVLGQDFASFEIVVVDDGSDEPETCRLLDGYRRPNTTLVRTQNRGVSAARNAGIAEAQGQYILPLDADDLIAPAYLRQAVAVLDACPKVGIVYCGAELFGELSGPWEMPEFSLPHQLLDNLIFSAAMFRRRDWEVVGGYDEKMAHGWEDWDYWLRLLGFGRQVVRLPGTLFAYRIRRGSRERQLTNWLKLRLVLRLAIKHRGLFARHAMTLLAIVCSGSRRRPARIAIRI